MAKRGAAPNAAAAAARCRKLRRGNVTGFPTVVREVAAPNAGARRRSCNDYTERRFMRKRGRRQFSHGLENLGALEMVLCFDVARSSDQNESRFTAAPAWREMLAEQASHFVLLCMDGIMGHPVDS